MELGYRWENLAVPIEWKYHLTSKCSYIFITRKITLIATNDQQQLTCSSGGSQS